MFLGSNIRKTGCGHSVTPKPVRIDRLQPAFGCRFSVPNLLMGGLGLMAQQPSLRKEHLRPESDRLYIPRNQGGGWPPHSNCTSME